jgi:quercetin dioxygenase-like cupin family protein
MSIVVGVVLAGPAIGAGLAGGQDSAETELTRAEIAEPFEMETNGASDYVVHKEVFDAGWSSGWHSHPGAVLVAVTAGEVTLYDGDDPSCTPRRYGAGQGFAETGGGVMLARNEGTAPAEVYVTYVLPAGSPLGSEEPGPDTCPF